MATLAELIELRDTLVVSIAESGGETSISVDGMSVTLDRNSQLATLNAEIARLQSTATNPRGWFSAVKLVSPGCGG